MQKHLSEFLGLQLPVTILKGSYGNQDWRINVFSEAWRGSLAEAGQSQEPHFFIWQYVKWKNLSVVDV